MNDIETNGDAQLTLASDTQNAEALRVVRESASTIATCLASMVDYLEDPLKSKFNDIKKQIDVMLASLPPSDMVPAANASNDTLQRLLNVMLAAQSMMTGLADVAKSSRTELQTVRASMTGEIDKAIDTKVKAGELFAKADHDKSVTDAVTAARSEWQTELKLVGDRRTALHSASLPIPADEQLSGKDEEFKARQDQAKARAEALKAYKVSGDKLVTLCWSTDKAAFDMALELLKENAVAPAPPAAQKPNGFITPTGDGKTAINLHRIVC